MAACAWATALSVGIPSALAAGPTKAEQRELEELVRDVERFSQAVKDFRGTARNAVRREFAEKQKQVRGKYQGAIDANERDEKERRKEALAQFEAFLQKYPNDKRFTPDAMFRLGELYYEKAADDHLTATEAYQKAVESDTPPQTAAPTPDFGRTIDLYKRLLTEFPNYRMLDRTYYILGYCLTEMQQHPQARQAFLALTCSNKYRALDPPPPAAAAGPSGPKTVIEDIYKECQPVQKDSRFLAESWTRVGESHFDAVPSELPAAISAFNRVLEFKDSGYFDRGLYKLAWSFYRDNRYAEAVKYFDELVKWSDARKASGEKSESDLRPESILYLGISFAEKDWDGDQVDDPVTGLSRAEEFYRGRDKEPHVREIFKILGDIYFDRTEYGNGVAVYKTLLGRFPHAPEAPKVQEQIVRSLERDRQLEQAARERAGLGNYRRGSEWAKHNADNPEALAYGEEVAENALVSSATTVHSQAINCRKTWSEAGGKDMRKLSECKSMYRTAASLYEKYLAAYPNTKNSYEYSWHYAEALNYSDQLPEAISAYSAVRESVLDNKYQDDAALQTVKVYEALIESAKASGRLQEPPIPDEKNTRPPVNAVPMPDLMKKYQEALDWYADNIKTDRAPDMRYQTAIIALQYRDWPEARKRLKAVTDAYCATKPEVGSKAYDALLKTYLIDYGVTDEIQKDCALGTLLSVAEDFAESACGKAPAAAPFMARMKDLKTSVKTKVNADILKLKIENDEKGTNKTIVQCKDGVGGIEIAMGLRPASAGGKASAPGEKRELGTGDLDEGVALGLMDMVKENPKDQDAPTNLNNACVVYEKLFKFGQATACYEKLYREYPQSPLATEALWNAAKNHYRFFEFEEAQRAFQTVAEDPKFARSEHRKEALGQAATMLENDQQYVKAAQLYRRYSDAIADKPTDSAQAHSFACRSLEKAKDTSGQQKCLNELTKKFGNQPLAGDQVIQAFMSKAQILEQGRDKNATLNAYKKVRDEFIARRLPAATPAAGFAAKADFLLDEEDFKDFQGKKLNFTNPKKIKEVFDTFVNETNQLKALYKKIWDYKDATWTLASMLRMGDIEYEFAQKLIKSADNPPEDLKKLEKQNCKLNPDDCGMLLQQYKDGIFQMVTPVEDRAKAQWKATLEQAAKLGVTNEYVKKARENLSKYLPDEFPFIKDERIQLELPQ